MMFFFILTTFTLHIILILLEEIMSRSPMGIQGLRAGKTFRLNSPRHKIQNMWLISQFSQLLL